MCHHFGKVGPFNQIHKQSATIKCGKPMYRPYSLNTQFIVHRVPKSLLHQPMPEVHVIINQNSVNSNNFTFRIVTSKVFKISSIYTLSTSCPQQDNFFIKIYSKYKS